MKDDIIIHPDILPPCPEAGGQEGRKRFAEACEELGYVLAILDHGMKIRGAYLDVFAVVPLDE